MFNLDRDSLRQQFFNAWQKFLDKKPLEPLEAQIVEVIQFHPEYHEVLVNPEASLSKDFNPELNQDNPFLHLSLHMAIQEQINTNRPMGINDVYKKLQLKLQDSHTAQHTMMQVLCDQMWLAIKNQQEPDENVYLQQLKHLL